MLESASSSVLSDLPVYLRLNRLLIDASISNAEIEAFMREHLDLPFEQVIDDTTIFWILTLNKREPLFELLTTLWGEVFQQKWIQSLLSLIPIYQNQCSLTQAYLNEQNTVLYITESASEGSPTYHYVAYNPFYFYLQKNSEARCPKTGRKIEGIVPFGLVGKNEIAQMQTILAGSSCLTDFNQTSTDVGEQEVQVALLKRLKRIALSPEQFLQVRMGRVSDLTSGMVLFYILNKSSQEERVVKWILAGGDNLIKQLVNHVNFLPALLTDVDHGLTVFYQLTGRTRGRELFKKMVAVPGFLNRLVNSSLFVSALSTPNLTYESDYQTTVVWWLFGNDPALLRALILEKIDITSDTLFLDALLYRVRGKQIVLSVMFTVIADLIFLEEVSNRNAAFLPQLVERPLFMEALLTLQENGLPALYYLTGTPNGREIFQKMLAVPGFVERLVNSELFVPALCALDTRDETSNYQTSALYFWFNLPQSFEAIVVAKPEIVSDIRFLNAFLVFVKNQSRVFWKLLEDNNFHILEKMTALNPDFLPSLTQHPFFLDALLVPRLQGYSALFWMTNQGAKLNFFKALLLVPDFLNRLVNHPSFAREMCTLFREEGENHNFSVLFFILRNRIDIFDLLIKAKPSLASAPAFLTALLTPARQSLTAFHGLVEDPPGVAAFKSLIELNPGFLSRLAHHPLFITTFCKLNSEALSNLYYLVGRDPTHEILRQIVEANPEILQNREFIRALCTDARRDDLINSSPLSCLLLTPSGKRLLNGWIKINPQLVSTEFLNVSHQAAILFTLRDLERDCPQLHAALTSFDPSAGASSSSAGMFGAWLARVQAKDAPPPAPGL